MNVSRTAIESVTVVRLAGNLDTNTSPEVQESLNKLINEGTSKVLVNFAEVDFVSSAGFRILLATAKRLGGSGECLRICDLNETVA